jgi:hypothetical protein
MTTDPAPLVAPEPEYDPAYIDPFLAARTRERDAALAVVEAVKALHVKHPRWDSCESDEQTWPCATAKLLEEK